MKKLFVYSDQNDNNSLGNLAHLLINAGYNGFNIGLCRLEFTVYEADAEQCKERISKVLSGEINFISIM